MTLTNDQLLAGLDAALKSVTDISDLGDSILQPAKFARFVREMQHRTTILQTARFINMDAQQVDIDRTGFVGRILRAGSAADGDRRVLTEPEFAVPVQRTNKLIAHELQAIASLADRALRRNIERGNFENTLIELFGQAAGRDLEEFALLADTNIPYATDDVLSQTDGWVRRAANKLYGVDTSTYVGKDFDPADAAYPENLFQAMLDGLPKQYIQNITDWRIYATWDVYDGWRDILKERGTDLGDQVLTGGGGVPWKGIPVVYAPMLERAPAVTTTQADIVEGEIAMLSTPANMAWGVFHEVTVEREREAKARRTDFVLTVEADAHYEDENAVCVAMIEKTNPALA